MEKEIKSCTGVLLRADLTGHSQFSQSADFCQKGWDGLALLVSPQKDALAGLETYFALLYFWTFARCVSWYLLILMAQITQSPPLLH